MDEGRYGKVVERTRKQSMLTPLDLKLEYRFDTGEYPATDADYAQWLEEQLLYIRNRMFIMDNDTIVGLKQFDALMDRIRKSRNIQIEGEFIP